MRKIAILLAASAALLLAGAFAFTADAMTGGAALGLRSAAKNFSPIDTVACRVSGPVCGSAGLGSAGRSGAAGAPAAGGSLRLMA